MLTPHNLFRMALPVMFWTVLVSAPTVGAQDFGDRPAPGDRAGDDDRPPRGGRPFFDRFSDQEREEVRQFMETHFPDQVAAMRRMERSGSQGFRGRFGKIMPRILRLMEEFEHDEEGAELGLEELRLEFKIRKRARRYQHQTGDGQRDQLRQEIAQLIAQRFDLHQKRSRQQIERFERRIDDLKRRVSHRDENRDAVVQQEVDAVLLPRDVFDRGGPSQRPDRGPGQRRGRKNRPGR